MSNYLLIFPYLTNRSAGTALLIKEKTFDFCLYEFIYIKLLQVLSIYNFQYTNLLNMAVGKKINRRQSKLKQHSPSQKKVP